MELLELEGMTGVPSPFATQIIEFKAIIDRDDSEEKYVACQELAYVHYISHHSSQYVTYDISIRGERLKKDIFGEDSDWEPDELIHAAIAKYKELTENEYTKLLQAARDAANGLRDYFEGFNSTKGSDAKDLIMNLSKLGGVVEGIEKLKEQVEKNEAKKNANRGGVITNEFSEG